MKKISVVGGRCLHGEIQVQGSKNAALPILAAALLNPGETVLHNCPRITDVDDMLQILKSLGCSIRREKTTVVVCADSLSSHEITGREAGKMRSSVLLMGSLLGRVSEARIAYPGGCVIGERPINLHLQGFRDMGFEITEEKTEVIGKGVPLGGSITLSFPSVGATENLLIAAAAAKAVTVLNGCAKEPEICELCGFLQSMGVGIFGGGTGRIVVCPPKQLHGAEYTIGGDRIVAGTYAIAAAGCGGHIRIAGVSPEGWRGQLYPLEMLGASVIMDKKEKALSVKAPETLRSITFLDTAPYPGFPTDLQSQMMAALTRAEGISCLQERMFEQRFKIIGELKKMGARIRNTNDLAVIEGVPRLYGACVEAQELRGGAALVIAGLMAEGNTSITGTGFIERGYEDISRDLTMLGAKIRIQKG